jgi:hypothetical protein
MEAPRENAAAAPRPDAAAVSIAIASGLAAALVAIFLCVLPLTGSIAASRDYVVYWATGQQLAHSANPYDAAAMDRLERSAGLDAGYGTLYMRNPPWALPLALPLGFLPLRLGATLWSLALLGCLAGSVLLLRPLLAGCGNQLLWLGLSFAPALVCVFMGQTALFALLGLAIFLRVHRQRLFSAGGALWLCALKPHLFLPFAAVLLVWIVVERRYKILAGAVLSLAAGSAAAALLAPSPWRAYLAMMRAPSVQQEFVPCLADALRLWLRPDAAWLQYLPAVLACLWALGYYWPRRTCWDWLRDGGLLLPVSLLAAPYCWLYDQGLAIPALLAAARGTRSRLLVAALALASLPIEASLVAGVRVISPIYLWTAPAWLAWYLLARAFPGSAPDGAAGAA